MIVAAIQNAHGGIKGKPVGIDDLIGEDPLQPPPTVEELTKKTEQEVMKNIEAFLGAR
jgi:hypothetical protein